jgi:hypothetical protein
MTQSKCDLSKDCKMCHKQAGLPIFLTRYAVASTAPSPANMELYGGDPSKTGSASDKHNAILLDKFSPDLLESFKVEDGPGGKTIDLGDGAKYTLRLLRPGYVYVYNPKDPKAKWRGYEVTAESYLQEFTVTPWGTPIGQEEGERKTAPCNPDKNTIMARCITIPDADNAESVWIGFSDTRWTKRLLELNEDEAFRNRHMRKLDLQVYRSGAGYDQYKHPHAINRVYNDPIIAEYTRHEVHTFTYGYIEKNAFKDFSPVPFHSLAKRQTLGVELKELSERTDKAGNSFKQYEGQSMVLALDDPAGIVMDLARLMDRRRVVFKKQKDFYRPLVINACLLQAQGAVYENTKKRLEDVKNVIESDEAYAASAEMQKLVEQLELPDTLQDRFEQTWRKYGTDYYDEEKRAAFFSEKSEYVVRTGQFEEQVIKPLAEAHKAWFQSPYLIDYFLCNFDSSEAEETNVVWIGEPKQDYRLHSGAYLELLNLCIGETGDNPVSREMYSEMFLSEPNERNLIWMALNMNRVKLAEDNKRAADALEALRQQAHPIAAALDALDKVSDEPTSEPDMALRLKIANFVAQYGWSSWDAFNNAMRTYISIFEADAPARMQALEDADNAYIKAKNKYQAAQKQWDIEITAAKQDAARAEKSSVQAGDDLNRARVVQAESRVHRDQTAERAVAADVQVDRTAVSEKRIELKQFKQSEELKKLTQELVEATDEFQKLANKLGTLDFNSPLGKLVHRLKGPMTTLITEHVNAITGRSVLTTRRIAFSPNTRHYMMALSALEGAPPIVLEEYGRPRTVRNMMEKTLGIRGDKPGNTGKKPNTPHTTVVDPPNTKVADLFKDLDPNIRISASVALKPDLQYLISSMFPKVDAPRWWESAYQFRGYQGSLEMNVKYAGQGARGKVWDMAHARYVVGVEAEFWRREVMRMTQNLKGQIKESFDATMQLLDALHESDVALRAAREAEADLARAEKNHQLATENVAQRQKVYDARLAKYEIAAKDFHARFEGRTKQKLTAAFENLKSKEAILAQDSAAVDTIQAKRMLGGGLAVLNAGLAWFVMASWKDTLDQTAPNDEKYREAGTMYYAAVATFAGGIVDLAVAGTAVAGSSFRWAAHLHQILDNPAIRFFSRATGSALSFVGAFWDLKRAMEFSEMGHTGWALAYGAASLLGAASGFVVFLGIAPHITIPVMIVYALFTLVVYGCSPSDLEKWLMQCHFGRYQNKNIYSNSFWGLNMHGELKAFEALGLPLPVDESL